MKIRKMKIDDYNNVYQLWLSCPGMGLNDIDDSLEGIDKFLKRNPNTCFVAEKKGKIIGTILGGHDGRRGYIYHTVVDIAFQKQGIGTQLVESLLTAFHNEAITKVALVFFKRNDAGNEFWQKQGFIKRDDIGYRNKALVEMVRIDT